MFDLICPLITRSFKIVILHRFIRSLESVHILWWSCVCTQVSAQRDVVTCIQVKAVFLFTPLLLLLLIGAQRVSVERFPSSSGGKRVLGWPLQSWPELSSSVVTWQTRRAVCFLLMTYRGSDLHLWHCIPEVIDSSHHHSQHGIPLHCHFLQPRVLLLALASDFPLYEEHKCDKDKSHYEKFQWVQASSEYSAKNWHSF